MLYSQSTEILPQVVAEFDNPAAIGGKLSCVPWGHHRLIIDKCRNDVNKAWFLSIMFRRLQSHKELAHIAARPEINLKYCKRNASIIEQI